MTQKILTIVVLVFSIATYGQKTEQELYLDYLENINKKDITTGFFLNRGFTSEKQLESLYQFIEGFDEETNEIVAPMSVIDGMSWIEMYKSLLTSEINSNVKLPSEENITNRLLNDPKTNVNIPILIFDVKGELLEEDEIENSINKKIKTVNYNQVHLFGASSYENTFYNKSIEFSLKKENYFSGFSVKESFVYIDFGDGNGVKKYSTSTGNISVNYSSVGQKVIKVFRDANLNSNKLRIGTSFQIKIEDAINRDPSIVIKEEKEVLFKSSLTSQKKIVGSETFETLTVSQKKSLSGSFRVNGMKASCFYGKGNNVLDRPIMIVQGFDPAGQINVDTQLKKYGFFVNNLLEAGYDLVFITINNTNLPLRENTDILKRLIKKINSNKVKNYESIIIGESMGGLLSRMALKELENEKYDHEFGLYVSFDTPHQGANYPPGLQSLFRDLLQSRTAKVLKFNLEVLDISTLGLANHIVGAFNGIDKKGTLNGSLGVNLAYRVLGSFNSSPAKSMLVRHVDSDGSEFEASQNYLKTLGYPEQTRNIALVNGSNSGRLQQKNDGSRIVPGEQIFRLPLWRSDSGCNEFSFNASSSPTNTTREVSRIKFKVGLLLPEIKIRWENRCLLKLFGKCRLKTKVPVKFKAGLKCASTNLIDKKQSYKFDAASYDDAPGSILPENDVELAFNTSFVPTASAIDIKTSAYNQSTNPNGLRAITSATQLDNLIRNDLTPFDEIYSQRANTTHVFLNDGNMPAIFNNLISDEFMNEDLLIQNKVIFSNRDFIAKDKIRIGNNMNTISNKIISNGNVIVDKNAMVNVVAGNEIILGNGTHFKNGANVSLNVLKKSGKILNRKIALEKFDIKIIGNTKFEFGKKPSFKVIVSDNNTNYDYDWKLIGKETTSNTNEFFIEELLNPGLYTVEVSVINGNTVKVLSKVFKVENFTSSKSLENDFILNSNLERSTIIYPNPVVNDDVTIAAKKEIESLTIMDINGSILNEFQIENTWGSLNFKNYSSGTYLINIIFSDKSAIKRKLIRK